MVKTFSAKEYLIINSELSPVVFENADKLYDVVNKGLLKIAKFWWNDAKKIFSTFKLRDMVVYGDMITYLYNQHSEISLGIVADISPKVLPYLEDINEAFVINELPYKFINRPVHCRFLPSFPSNAACYSLSNHCWINKAELRNFSFSFDEFDKAFEVYDNGFSQFVSSLPKHKNNLLTMDACQMLEDHLKLCYRECMSARIFDSEKEYSLKYLLGRTFIELGGFAKARKYIADSYNYNINVLQQ